MKMSITKEDIRNDDKRKNLLLKHQLQIFEIEITELLVEIKNAFRDLNFNNRLSLYRKYLHWDQKAIEFLINSKYTNYFNEWLMVKEFFPKKHPAINSDATGEKLKTAEEIYKDLNELKGIIKEQNNILARIKEEFDRNEGDKIFEEKGFHFDVKNCCFLNRNKYYKPSDKTRKELIQKLWTFHQRQNDKGKIKKEGERFPESYFAIQINMIREVKEFENKNTRKRFKEMIKGLNRIFKDKEFPIKINSEKKGLLLILII